MIDSLGFVRCVNVILGVILVHFIRMDCILQKSRPKKEGNVNFHLLKELDEMKKSRELYTL